MTRIDKLINKIESQPYRTDITLEEVIKYLEYFGFFVDRTKGSHVVFKHLDGVTFPIPNHSGPIRACYVKQAVEKKNFVK